MTTREADVGPVALHPRFKAVSLPGEGAFALSADETELFEGQIYTRLLPLLNGSFDREAIVDALSGDYSPTEVYYALNTLDDRGVLSRGAPVEELDRCPSVPGLGLDGFRFVVTTCGEVDGQPLVAALARAGAEVIPRADDSGDIEIVVTDNYLNPRLADINARNLRDNRPWILTRPASVHVWAGPIFGGDAGCWSCLAFRLRTNDPVATYLSRRLGWRNHRGDIPLRAGVGRVAATMIALELMHVSRDEGSDDRILVFDTRTAALSSHPFKPRPQCPDCGRADMQMDWMTRPVDVRRQSDSRDIAGSADHRRHVDPITGVVTQLLWPETGCSNLHSCIAVFGFGRDAPDLDALKRSWLSHGIGVGSNAEQAEAGAVYEAIERYSGMSHGDEPAFLAAYRDLDPEQAIHPNSCMLYSETQYERRDEWNRSESHFAFVPRRFSETDVVHWTGVWSLTRERFRLLPTSYLFYNFPQPPQGPYCWADSNGCAAGRTLADAIARGLLELIERDSVALWWYNRLRRPGIDLRSLGSPYIDDLLADYESLNREVWALDLTADLGIPSVAAVSQRVDPGPRDILLGFAAHLDVRTAVEKAFREMNHLVPAVLHRDGGYAYPDPAHQAWWRKATTTEHPYLTPDGFTPVERTDELTLPDRDDAVALVDALQERLQERGLEILVIEQTRPDIGVPVAKVIVPGLRHFWARFAPGRLYDVPVQMGWLGRRLAEHELNPVPLFL